MAHSTFDLAIDAALQHYRGKMGDGRAIASLRQASSAANTAVFRHHHRLVLRLPLADRAARPASFHARFSTPSAMRIHVDCKTAADADDSADTLAAYLAGAKEAQLRRITSCDLRVRVPHLPATHALFAQLQRLLHALPLQHLSLSLDFRLSRPPSTPLYNIWEVLAPPPGVTSLCLRREHSLPTSGSMHCPAGDMPLMSSLRKLALPGGDLTSKGVAALARAAPNLEVLHAQRSTVQCVVPHESLGKLTRVVLQEQDYMDLGDLAALCRSLPALRSVAGPVRRPGLLQLNMRSGMRDALCALGRVQLENFEACLDLHVNLYTRVDVADLRDSLGYIRALVSASGRPLTATFDTYAGAYYAGVLAALGDSDMGGVSKRLVVVDAGSSANRADGKLEELVRAAYGAGFRSFFLATNDSGAAGRGGWIEGAVDRALQGAVEPKPVLQVLADPRFARYEC